MNVIKDIQSLIQLIHSREEVIVFPIGAEGQQLLDFLRYTNFLQRVCCIAAPQVDGNNTRQDFIHEVPIIPFEHLVHFRETALFIVVAPNQYHQKFYEDFTNFGFKNIALISDELQTQIKAALQNMARTGQIMMWYFQHFEKKITSIEHLIEEQNEISEINTRAFAAYRNAFLGKDVVILGSGPTMDYYKPIPNAINIGVNYAWRKENLKIDYLFTNDFQMKVSAEERTGAGFNKIGTKVFVGRRLYGVWDSYLDYAPNIDVPFEKLSRFYINEITFGQPIFPNICHHPLPHFGTTIFSPIHFALFTAPKKIYLVGCDTSRTGYFFMPKENRGYSGFSLELAKVGYARTKMFARQYYPETEIISINPVGLRGLFKDVYTEEYQTAVAQNKI